MSSLCTDYSFSMSFVFSCKFLLVIKVLISLLSITKPHVIQKGQKDTYKNIVVYLRMCCITKRVILVSHIDKKSVEHLSGSK